MVGGKDFSLLGQPLLRSVPFTLAWPCVVPAVCVCVCVYVCI